jgi:hypothetical protein
MGKRGKNSRFYAIIGANLPVKPKHENKQFAVGYV